MNDLDVILDNWQKVCSALDELPLVERRRMAARIRLLRKDLQVKKHWQGVVIRPRKNGKGLYWYIPFTEGV